MSKRKRYNKDFRLQAAQLVVHQGYSQAEAASRLGVSSNSIANWIKDLRASGDLVETKETRSESEENRELRKRVRRLEMENEILKKAAAYFAKESI